MSAVPAVWLSASCDLCGWQELKAAPAPADATAPMCAHTCPVNAAHVLAPAAVALPPTPSGNTIGARMACGWHVDGIVLPASTVASTVASTFSHPQRAHAGDTGREGVGSVGPGLILFYLDGGLSGS